MNNLTLGMACAGIEDRRAGKVCRLDPAELLFVAMVTVLMGAFSHIMMAEHAKRKRRWFRRQMPFANGMPSAGTLRNVLGALDPAQVRWAFTEWMRSA